jgi:SAM-dependent methyltransferase
MNDSLRAAYDAIPYRHGPVPDSHPARLGAIARLHGVAAAAPEKCRVLELGCAEGMNLLPLAERLPHAEFTGVDFSPVQIATAEAARTACGIGNARFICADLRTFEPEEFDYIIVHGVYSWVPDDVKDRTLAICGRALAPDGVAYVSYNTLPGWSLLAGLRQVLLSEIAIESDPAVRLAHAQRVLTTLDQCAAGQPGAYAAMLREAIADMRAKPPALLFHDELAGINDPVTFTQFTSHAARHSLHYLAEAHYATMPYEHVPVAMRTALAELHPDFTRAQQFMDVIFQRWLRNSLLVRTAPPSVRPVNPRIIPDCALGLRMRASSDNASPFSPPLLLAPGTPLRLLGPNELSIDFDRPLEKAFFTVLASAAPRRIPFPEALESAHQLLHAAGLPADADSAPLHGVLYRLFALDALDLVLIGDGKWLRTAPAPAPSPLMRYQGHHHFAVTNRWHEPVTLTGDAPRTLIDPAHPANPAALEQAGLAV